MEVMIEKDIDKPVTNSQQIVTLVHGTWAHDADWVKSDSKIYRRLEQLGPNTLIQSFQWSGNNSHNARLKAANKLSKKITDTASKYPDAKQHLIAHSHGGNVAKLLVQVEKEQDKDLRIKHLVMYDTYYFLENL